MNREIPRNVGYGDLPPNHKHILNLARKNGGFFRYADYEEQLKRQITRESHGNDYEKAIRSLLNWNRKSVARLMELGALRQVEDGIFQASPDLLKAHEAQKPFVLKPNHIRLLKSARDGKLLASDLYAGLEQRAKTTTELDRQWRIHKGMLKNLTQAGYLEPGETKGEYQLTGKALEVATAPLPEPERRNRKNGAGFQVTSFDQQFAELAKQGRFTREELDAHPRGPALSNRLDTLLAMNLIQETPGGLELTEELADRIRAAEARAKRLPRNVEILTRGQKAVVRDMMLFSQLNERQIRQHLLTDKRFSALDMGWLARAKIIEYEPVCKVYLLTAKGAELGRELLGPKARYFKSKALYRPAEVPHDLLVYDAYKDITGKLEARGCTVTDVKTDRELRSAYNTQGLRDYLLPDLRVFYRNERGERDFINVEIDVGHYDTRQIQNKLGLCHGNAGIQWYAPSQHAAKRAIEVALRCGFRVASAASTPAQGGTLHTAKTLYVTVLDEDLQGKHRIPFKEGRRFSANSRKKAST